MLAIGNESPFTRCPACGALLVFRVWVPAVASMPGHWREEDALVSPVCGVPHVCVGRKAYKA